jgi:hypothetical protein
MLVPGEGYYALCEHLEALFRIRIPVISKLPGSGFICNPELWIHQHPYHLTKKFCSMATEMSGRIVINWPSQSGSVIEDCGFGSVTEDCGSGSVRSIYGSATLDGREGGPRELCERPTFTFCNPAYRSGKGWGCGVVVRYSV